MGNSRPARYRRNNRANWTNRNTTWATIEVEENPEGQPPEVVEQSQAFAKRLQERTQAALMEERQRWEQEVSERYGNYDTIAR